MAGNVPKRVLKQPEVDKCLLGGTRLWKFEENEPPQKLTFYSDKDAFFLWAVGDNPSKYYDQYIWDLQTISDVRSGKPPKDSKLPQPSDDTDKGGIFLTLVVCKDGIVNLDMHNLTAETPAIATTFKKAVNSLTRNMLMAHAAPAVFLKKQYVRIKLHANGNGEIPLKSINKVMMVRYSPDNFLNQWLGSFNIVKDSADGKSKVIHVDDFTEDLFSKMLDQLLNNRDKDMDVVFSNLTTAGKHRGKMSLPLNDFLKFLNERQRDPRLNEILFPITKKSEAGALIERYEKGRTKDRLTGKGLMEYLASEENNVLDMDHLNQNHDMSQPICNYYINSSHNTYLTGHQLRSSSTTEMYAQCLLMGCRCLELDCWVENDDIIITHGGTFCGKVGFREVVETINEFAFVASDYPVILSIENHCRKYPHLLQRMATIFKMVFGEKLMGSPLEDFPLVEGQSLPPPERLKHKILIKDKKVRRGANTSMTNLTGTLQRGTHLPSVPEEMEGMADGGTSKDTKKKSEEDQDSVTSDIPNGAMPRKEEGEEGEGEEKVGSSEEEKSEKEREGSYDLTDGEQNKEQSEVAESDPAGGVEGAVVIKLDVEPDGQDEGERKGGEGETKPQQQTDTPDSPNESASSPNDDSSKVATTTTTTTTEGNGAASGLEGEGEGKEKEAGGGRKTPDTPGSVNSDAANSSNANTNTNTNTNTLSPGNNSEGGGESGEPSDSVKLKRKALAILGIDEEEESRGSTFKRGSLSGSAAEGDITQINVALLHRTSDADITVTGPLADLINYCTSISFEGFAVAEKTNCAYYMSSFVEEKGLNLIKTQGKDFVKYNQRQFSRIYPQGSRISSSNYGPLIYWSVGCQMVALNFQTSDIPMQMNTAKFEFNGGTGYLLKPWVMTRDRAGTGSGDFNPFVQSKLEDIVPARLTIKIISGFFLTSPEKKTNCYAECEMFGLPADNLRHKYYTKRVAGPHPHWNDDEFRFKRILLPELAMLRVCVYDDDKEIVGQRVLPVNAIRPGFRHINLRDKHGTPLPLAMLFVLITVEDWVPDEMEDIVAMLMDPISYATQVLKEMDEDLGDDEKEFMAKQTGGKDKDQPDSASKDSSSKSFSLAPKTEEVTRSVSPKHEPERRSSGQTSTLGLGNPTPYASQSLKRGEGGLVAKPLPGAFDDTLPCLESAKTRDAPKAIKHDDSIVLEHGDYKKLQSKLEKKRSSLLKSHEKTLKTLQEKLAKGKPGTTDDHIKELQKKHTIDLVEFDKKASTEKYEKKRSIIESAHKVQMKALTDKVHKTDVKTVTLELGETMRKHRKGSDFGAGLDRTKSLMAEIEDKTVTLGRKTRTEFKKIHESEVTKLKDRQKQAIKDLVQWQAMELDKINSRLETATDGNGATP